MADYKYTSNLNNSAGDIRVNLSRETVHAGDKLTVSGVFKWNSSATKSIEASLCYGPPSAAHYGGFASLNKSVDKATTGSFAMDMPVPDFDEYIDGRAGQIGIDIILCAKANGDISGNYVSNSRDRPLIVYAKYPLEPQILEMDFERAVPSGFGYSFTDDGQYLMCKTLKISKNAQATVDDFTTARIVCMGSDGSTRTANLTAAQLTAALTANGYSESEPNVFAGFASALGVTYTLTLTLGDDYEQVIYTDTVMQSFARLHLSGASTGGVAVGKFSAATEGHPLFEVAEDHEAIFYGGIRGVTDYDSEEVATGGKWIDGKPIYRCVFTKSGLNGGSTTTIGTLNGTPDTVLSVEAVAHGTSSSGMIIRPFGFITSGASNGGDSSVSISKENRNVDVRIGTNWGTNMVVVVIEYTRA